MNATLPNRVSEARPVTIVSPGAADAYWLVTELTEILLANGQMDVLAVTVPPGGGPPAHIHRREDELFYVIEGSFEFTFGERKFIGGPGTCVFLPRNAVHRFQNVGDSDGRFLVTIAPGGFSKLIAHVGDYCIDPSVKPQVGPATFEKLNTACARVGIELLPNWRATRDGLGRHAPRELWVMGMHVKLLLTSKETAGQFSVAEITAASGDFVPPHSHRREDEFFYVLDGLVEFDLPRGTLLAQPGTFIHVPRQTMHAFRNVGDSPARLIDVHTPGGFENFFIDAGTPCLDHHRPPHVAQDLHKFLQICRGHGMEIAE